MRRRRAFLLMWISILAVATLTGCEQRSGQTSARSSGGGASAGKSRSVAQAPQTAARRWKVGAILPCSGGQAAYGQEALSGIMMKVEEINAKGGILGKPLEVVVENDEGQTNKTAEAAAETGGSG